MRSLLVLAALVHRVEALMLMCTPRSANAFVVLMQAQSDSAQPISMSRFADMADKALAGKDQALAAMDELLAAKDELIDLHRLRTPQNHPLLGRPRVTLSCLSRAYLVRVAFAETYQRDLKLSSFVAILHARSVVEILAAIFCRDDARIRTHSAMIGKFLNGEVRGPTRMCSVRCRVHSRCPPPPMPDQPPVLSPLVPVASCRSSR